jgi:hypothetical protein
MRELAVIQGRRPPIIATEAFAWCAGGGGAADLKDAIHSLYVRDPSGNVIELKSGV